MGICEVELTHPHRLIMPKGLRHHQHPPFLFFFLPHRWRSQRKRTCCHLRPSTMHWSMVKWILCYLKRTLNHDLFLCKHAVLHLYAFVNVDRAWNFDDITSTLGYIVLLRATPISWSSKNQKTVARSVIEPKYHVITVATTELNWVLCLLMELNINSTFPPTIYCDNIGSMYLCANPIFYSCMKHIAMDCHFVRDQVVKHQLCISHMHMTDQLVESLTMPLAHKLFSLYRSKIDISSILRGYDSR